MSVPGLLGHAELVPPGVGEERAAGALRGEAGLGPGLAALHLEGAVLCSQQEGTPGQGGGGRDQHHQHCHHHLYTKLQPHRRHLGYGSHVKHSNNRCPEEQYHYCNIMLKMYIKSANLHFLLYATGKLETAFNFAH